MLLASPVFFRNYTEEAENGVGKIAPYFVRI